MILLLFAILIPLIKVNDTTQIDLETGKRTNLLNFDIGILLMMTRGAILGRISVITNKEKHPGSFYMIHMKDTNGNSFASMLSNIFAIGKANKPCISPPQGKRTCLTIAEERETKD